jgi:hypothetical protein
MCFVEDFFTTWIAFVSASTGSGAVIADAESAAGASAGGKSVA